MQKNKIISAGRIGQGVRKREVRKRLVAVFAGILLFGGSAAFGDLSDGLAEHHPLDGSAINSLGTGNDGTARGAMPTTDRFGNPNSAYALGGWDDIVFPSGPPVSANGSFTYAFWMVSTLGGAYPVYEPYSWIWLVDRTWVSDPVVSLAIFTRDDGTNSQGTFWFFPRYDDYSVPGDVVTSAGIGGLAGGRLTPQEWQHIAMVREYGDSFKLYVNGTLVASAADSGKPLTPPAVDLGRNPNHGETGLRKPL